MFEVAGQPVNSDTGRRRAASLVPSALISCNGNVVTTLLVESPEEFGGAREAMH